MFLWSNLPMVQFTYGSMFLWSNVHMVQFTYSSMNYRSYVPAECLITNVPM